MSPRYQGGEREIIVMDVTCTGHSAEQSSGAVWVLCLGTLVVVIRLCPPEVVKLISREAELT